MSRVLVPGRPSLVGSHVILRLLAAGREVRTMVGSPMRAAEVRAMVDTGDGRPGAHLSFIARGRNRDTGGLDAVAGCEFLDDRIRSHS
jgi:nucleoside-diphosphate-sugar epimerase